MAWREARTATMTAPHRVAHDDASKERPTEAGLTTSPRRWRLPVVALVVLVLVGAGVAAVALTSDDPRPTARPSGGSTSSDSPASASDPSAAAPEGELFRGRVLSDAEKGTTERFALTLRVACDDSCQVTVVRPLGRDGLLARIFAEHTFAPAGAGRYTATWSRPVDLAPPGCEALVYAGTTTLRVRAAEVEVSGRWKADSLGSGGGQCTLGARDFEFRGSPKQG
jgi:hypothetical protein